MGIVKVLILKGDGINCERELGSAFLDSGAEITYKHINDLLTNAEILHQFDILGFPGGFSFGDELRSGKVLAIKLKHYLGKDLARFIADKKLIIGICNGFQALVQLDVFNPQKIERNYALTENDHEEFRDFWTTMKVEVNSSPWFSSLEGEFLLPVRHKEGRLVGLISNSQKILKYTNDINGSIDRTAGMIDETGCILGMMPHPEAALDPYLYPTGEVTDPKILNNIKKLKMIFSNAINYSLRRKM
jgi:phosphoribosylformylglycinamidine synthase